MKELTIKRCLSKLNKYIKDTPWEGCDIEWGVDIDTDSTYTWVMYDPHLKKKLRLTCNKITGVVTEHVSWTGGKF